MSQDIRGGEINHIIDASRRRRGHSAKSKLSHVNHRWSETGMKTVQKTDVGVFQQILECQLVLLSFIRGCVSLSDMPHPSSFSQWLGETLEAETIKLRPVADWRSSVSVRVDLSILSVLEVDEKNEHLLLSILYKQGWRDERLGWDPAQFGGMLRATVPISKIWVPDIILDEMVNMKEHHQLFQVSVSSAGWVELRQPRLLSSSCPLDLYHFPLDHHTCNLTFLSHTHTVREVELYWGEMDRDGMFSRGEWEIVSLSVPAHLDELQHLNTSSIRVQVCVRRSPLLYVVTLMLPSSLMLVLNLLSFIIPVFLKQRLSVMATVCTGHFIFIITIFTLFPAYTRQLPLIEVYLFGTLALLAFGAVETAFLFQLANGGNHWVTQHLFPKLWRLIGHGHRREPETQRGSSVCSCVASREWHCALQVELDQVRRFLQVQRRDRCTLSMCRELGLVLDRAYLCLHVLVLAGGGAALYSQWRRGLTTVKYV